MAKPTLQEMSDYLAEHLLGWKIRYGYWINQNNGFAFNHSVSEDLATPLRHPHTDIAQCFDYIVPAMRDMGFRFEIEYSRFAQVNSEEPVWEWHAANRGLVFADNASAAIVETAYQAIRDKK